MFNSYVKLPEGMGGSNTWCLQTRWVNYNDLTTTSLEMMVCIGKSFPFMAEKFRLVNYCDLPRFMGGAKHPPSSIQFGMISIDVP